MKINKLLVSMLTFGVVGHAHAQSSSYVKENPNQIKFNVMTLAGSKVSLEYERLLAKHVAIGVAVSMRPEANLPLRSSIADIIDDDRLTPLIEGFRGSNFSVTPELRFYTSSKGDMRGFYIAPFVKYTAHEVLVPYHFDYEVKYYGRTVYDREEIINLEGNTKSYTAGVSFGVNFKLSKHLMLDWRIVGPGYGFMDGQLVGKAQLADYEQDGLRAELADLSKSLEDMPMGIDVDYSVNGEGVTFDVNKSPWATVRTGLSLSYKF